MKIVNSAPSPTRRYLQASPRGQLTLPISIRKALEIQADTLLDVALERGRVVITPVRASVNAKQLRQYSDADITEFLAADRINPADRRFVDRLLKQRP